MAAQEFQAPESVGRLQQRALLIGGVALLVSILGAVRKPGDFYPSYLMSFLLILGLTVGSLGLVMLQHLTSGHWGIIIRRPLEAATRTLPLVMNWWVAFPPIQSTPLIRNRLVSCRWPATEKPGKLPPPPMFELLLTTPGLSSRSRSKLRPFSGRSLTCCSVINPDVELNVVLTSGASSLTVICSAAAPTSKVRSITAC